MEHMWIFGNLDLKLRTWLGLSYQAYHSLFVEQDANNYEIYII